MPIETKIYEFANGQLLKPAIQEAPIYSASSAHLMVLVSPYDANQKYISTSTLEGYKDTLRAYSMTGEIESVEVSPGVFETWYIWKGYISGEILTYLSSTQATVLRYNTVTNELTEVINTDNLNYNGSFSSASALNTYAGMLDTASYAAVGNSAMGKDGNIAYTYATSSWVKETTNQVVDSDDYYFRGLFADSTYLPTSATLYTLEDGDYAAVGVDATIGNNAAWYWNNTTGVWVDYSDTITNYESINSITVVSVDKTIAQFEEEREIIYDIEEVTSTNTRLEVSPTTTSEIPDAHEIIVTSIAEIDVINNRLGALEAFDTTETVRNNLDETHRLGDGEDHATVALNKSNITDLQTQITNNDTDIATNVTDINTKLNKDIISSYPILSNIIGNEYVVIESSVDGENYRIATSDLGGEGVGGGNATPIINYYDTPTDLRTAYPEDAEHPERLGWRAAVHSTDTFWDWNGATPAWEDTTIYDATGDFLTDNETNITTKANSADVYSKTAADLRYEPIDSDIVKAPSGVLPILDGSNLTGVSTVGSIDDLTDVDTTTSAPSDGQVLTWNNSNSEWEPQTIAGGVTDINDLSDVNATTPADKHVLVYDGVDSFDSRFLVEADITDLGSYETADADIVKAPSGVLPILDGSNLTGVSGIGHTHDDIYYTETEIDTQMGNKLDTSLKGVNSGLAELDSSGFVPAAQLPSFVDDVLEYANEAAFPGTGESGKIYIAIDTLITYRWSGSVYVIISDTLALGEISTTAYRGDRGKTAYDHSQVAHAPSDANNYSHPANHAPSIITQDASNRFVTDTEKSTWNAKSDAHSHPYEAANANIQSHITGDGSDHTDVATNTADIVELNSFYNGTILETFDALTYVDGTEPVDADKLKMTLEKAGTGDLTMRFSDGQTVLDCSPKLEIILGQRGGSEVSANNFIYITKTNKYLEKSATDWPNEEHIKIAFIAGRNFDDQDPVLVNQNWNDHMVSSDNQGHLSHITSWIRRQGATWYSGVAGAGTNGYIELQTAGANVYVKTAAGVVSQLHLHDFAAFDTTGTDYTYTLNWVTGVLTPTQNLNIITTDANSGTLNNKYFNLVLFATANKGADDIDIVAVNIPNGSYGKLADAVNDIDGHDVFTLPENMTKNSGTAFLLARVTMKLSGSTYTVHNTLDLRNTSITSASGGGSTAQNEFADSLFKIYDLQDSTREILFDAGDITTGNSRTITMADSDIDLFNIENNYTLVSEDTQGKLYTTLPNTTLYNGKLFRMDVANLTTGAVELTLSVNGIGGTYKPITWYNGTAIVLIDIPASSKFVDMVFNSTDQAWILFSGDASLMATRGITWAGETVVGNKATNDIQADQITALQAAVATGLRPVVRNISRITDITLSSTAVEYVFNVTDIESSDDTYISPDGTPATTGGRTTLKADGEERFYTIYGRFTAENTASGSATATVTATLWDIYDGLPGAGGVELTNITEVLAWQQTASFNKQMDATLAAGGDDVILYVDVVVSDGEVDILDAELNCSTKFAPASIETNSDNVLLVTPTTESMSGSEVDQQAANIGIVSAIEGITNSIGAANGIAELDSGGKVPSTQLPSYVDDVLEGFYDLGNTEAHTHAAFYDDAIFTTVYGTADSFDEIGKIYVDRTVGTRFGDTYRWSGSGYIQIGDLLSGSEIKTLYEVETNAFTDTLYTKLDGIASGAQPGTVTNVTASGPAISSDGGTVPNIVHTTTTGYKHIPSGGSSGQVLTYSTDGTAQWAAVGGGTVTEVTVGEGLDVTTGTTTPNITLDLSELPTSVTNTEGDFFVVTDDLTVSHKMTKANIELSGFNNDLSWTSNLGTVTSVTTTGPALTVTGTTVPNIVHTTTTGYKHIPSGGASGQVLTYSSDGTAVWASGGGTVTEVTVGDGLDITNGTSTPNITLDLSELPTSTTNTEGDYFVVTSEENVSHRMTKANIELSGFNNDSSWTSNAGTVTNVTATGSLSSSEGTIPEITHAVTAGNKHIPSGGSTDQALTYSADGTAQWTTLTQSDISDFTHTHGTDTDLTLTNEITVYGVGDVGGYSNDDVITVGTDIQDILQKLLIKAVPPIYAFSVTSLSKSYVEIGAVQNVDLNVTWIPYDASAPTDFHVDLAGTGTIYTDATPADPTDYTSIGVNFNTFADRDYTSYLSHPAGNGLPAQTNWAKTDDIKVYRYIYFTDDTSQSAPATGAEVRGWSTPPTPYVTSSRSFSISVESTDYRISIAIPAGFTLSSVKHVEGLNAEISQEFDMTAISVEGANGYTSESYEVWYQILDATFPSTQTYNVIVATA